MGLRCRTGLVARPVPLLSLPPRPRLPSCPHAIIVLAYFISCPVLAAGHRYLVDTFSRSIDRLGIRSPPCIRLKKGRSESLILMGHVYRTTASIYRHGFDR